MPARHGGPRVHSNNASRGAGRACAGLGHCGSLRARGACFAPELCFPKRLHHSVVGGAGNGGGVHLGVPIAFQHFAAPGFLEEVKNPSHLRFVVIMLGVGVQGFFVVAVVVFVV